MLEFERWNYDRGKKKNEKKKIKIYLYVDNDLYENNIAIYS